MATLVNDLLSLSTYFLVQHARVMIQIPNLSIENKYLNQLSYVRVGHPSFFNS